MLSCLLGAISEKHKKESISQSSMIATNSPDESSKSRSILNFDPSFNVTWSYDRMGAFTNIYSKLFSFVLSKSLKA